jgi:hypothetical protein
LIGWPGWNVTVFVPTSMGGFSDFPWDPSARQVVSNANVPYLSYHDDFAKDFPGTPADDFALIATSNIAVSAGYRRFCTNSADGSWLFVDSRLLVIHQGLHSASISCQSIYLDEGIHTISVNYFAHDGSATLEVYMDASLITGILNGKNLQKTELGGLGVEPCIWKSMCIRN